MADKKHDDFSVRMPVIREADLVSPLRRTARQPDALARLWTKIEHNPLASVFGYCIASISMTLVNKYVVSGRYWNLNFLYLAMQSIIAATTIMGFKNFGVVKDLPPFDVKKAQRWFPISCLLVGMIYTGNKALQFLSVPVFTIFKNLTIIVIAYGEVLWFGGSVSSLSMSAFGLMVLSSIIAAWADIQSALSGDHAATVPLSTLNTGYAWMGLNVMCSASYTLRMRKVMKTANLKDAEVTFYNNLLTIPVLVVASLLVEDWSSANFEMNFPAESRHHMFIGILYSGFMAVFISFSTAWCVRATSSTTYAMVGALNKLPLAVIGLVFFAAPITFGSVTAIILGFISGIVYTVAKTQKSQPSGATLPVMSASAQSTKDASR